MTAMLQELDAQKRQRSFVLRKHGEVEKKATA